MSPLSPIEEVVLRLPLTVIFPSAENIIAPPSPRRLPVLTLPLTVIPPGVVAGLLPVKVLPPALVGKAEGVFSKVSNPARRIKAGSVVRISTSGSLGAVPLRRTSGVVMVTSPVTLISPVASTFKAAPV